MLLTEVHNPKFSIEGNNVEQKSRVKSAKGAPKTILLKYVLAAPNGVLKMVIRDLEAGKVGFGCLLQLMAGQHVSNPICHGRGHEKVINYG